MRPESAPKQGEAVPLAGNESGPASEQDVEPPPKPALKIPPILLEGDEPMPLPAPPTGPDHKFELGPPPAPDVQPPLPPSSQAPIQAAELPESYGTGRLLVTARDPHSVYVHWDLGIEDQRQHIASSRDKQLLVRLRPEPPTERQPDEVQVGPEARHAFVQVARAGTAYAAELGYYREDGQWQKIAGPESVATPPETVSRETSVRFAAFPEGFPWKPEAGPAGKGVRAPAVLKVEGTPGAAGAPARVGFVRPAVQESGAANRGEVVEAARPGGWGTAQESALAEVVGQILMRSISLSSAEIAELIRGRRPTEVVSMLEEFAFAGLEAAVSSPLGGQMPEQRGFWLNVNAELIVYGATEPDALVTIGGQPIQLRPDGTFSLRFALPDGIHGVAVAATSVQGEQRQARLQFQRTTTYEG